MHRDLKPANIALPIDGQVKVLDAKALQPDPVADVSNSPTMSLAATHHSSVRQLAQHRQSMSPSPSVL